MNQEQAAVRHIAQAKDNERVIDRAFAAWFRAGKRAGATSPDIPANDSYLCELAGRRYVILQNINGIMAVYRVKTNGILREMRRWPRELDV